VQVRQTVADRQVKHRGSHGEHAATPASKYRFIQEQNGLKLVNTRKLAELQVSQVVPFEQLWQAILQAMQGVEIPSS
jgi:hypothetical protein